MFPIIFIILVISVVALITLGVGAMHDARQTTVGRSSIVRRGYIYLVSFVTLLFLGAALISILDVGLRAWVFRSADPYIGYFNVPPSTLYLTSKDGSQPVSGPTVLGCTNGCALTDQQKADITSWEQNYLQWQEVNTGKSGRMQALITPLSFFIVALVVFLFHWRLVRRDAKTIEEGNNLTRSAHFTAMGFVWLLVCVITAGFLVNTLLRMAIPGAERKTNENISYPAEVVTQEKSGVASIVTCGDACGLSEETVQRAQTWEADYARWLARNQSSNDNRSRQNAFSIELALLLVGLPLVWYHLRTAWREKNVAKG